MMKTIRDFSIQQTVVLTITVILAISVLITVVSVYSIITVTTKELVSDQASEINKQIVLNYESYTNRVSNLTNLLQEKIIEYDTITDFDELTKLFVSLEEIEESVSAITLFDNSGEVIISTRRIVLDSKEIGIKEWYKRAVFDANILHYSSPYQQVIYGKPNEEVISTSKVIDYNSGYYDRKGVLLIDMNFEGLDSLSTITNLGELGHILILDNNDQIVYSSDDSIFGYNSESYQIVKELVFGRTNTVINKTSMAINVNTISSTRWRIATFQNINMIDVGMKRALYTVVALILITMMVTILVSFYIANKITNPLKKLDRAIIEFQKGIYDSKVEIEGQIEVKIVTRGFNAMIDKIHQLMEEVVKEQEGKRQSELAVLQNQINPHFLYNTLDCMIWLAEQNRNEDLVNTVNALSTVFRISLSKGKQFITIAEELKHIESYLMIQKIRYNDKFDYSIMCDPSVSELKLMKLLLQPIVENAIYHGVDKDDEDSYIHIRVFEKNSNVILSVVNSGYGISEKKINEIHNVMLEGNDNGSIGMKNVFTRIKLFYGAEAKIDIESELDESTTISILIPIELLTNT